MKASEESGTVVRTASDGLIEKPPPPLVKDKEKVIMLDNIPV